MARRPLIAILALALAALLAGALFDQDKGHSAYAKRHHERVDTVVTVGRNADSPPVPSGFVGLSIEYPALTWYTGNDPSAVNPAFEQLIRNLAPDQSPVLRIGGDSTDTTWWPTPGLPRPGGVSFSLSANWIAIMRALARSTRARLIMGIDLEAGVPQLAVSEGRALSAGLGPHLLRAFEIGNEAPRYPKFPWYHAGPERPVLARAPSYDFADFNREYDTVGRRLPSAVPLAGPNRGGPDWMTHHDQFIARAPRLALVTFHEYPFNRCFTPLSSPVYPTLPRLLTRDASRGFAGQLSGYRSVAARHGLPFRVDEINSVACGGKRGVSDTFASALWSLDALFELARLGVSGVNFHMFPGAHYILFSFRRRGGQWLGTVAPEYYGLLLFAQAAPAGSQLLATTTLGPEAVRAWATRGPDGTLRVVLINDDRRHRHVFLVKSPSGATRASVIRLTAPSARATAGVQLGEQSFGLTSTGRLPSPPEQEPISASRGRLVVALGPASAAMVTVGGS